VFQPKQWPEKASREDNRKQDPTRTCAQSGVKIEHCSRCPNDQFELSWLQYRKIGRFCALQNAARVDAGLPKGILTVIPVAHQTADFDGLSARVACWNLITGGKRG
jgi:hypothetical protein